jgi:hypothetical protein
MSEENPNPAPNVQEDLDKIIEDLKKGGAEIGKENIKENIKENSILPDNQESQEEQGRE